MSAYSDLNYYMFCNMHCNLYHAAKCYAIFLQVSDKIGAAGGAIYHPTCRQSCPEKCDYHWVAYDDGEWKADETLMITCGNA